MLPSSHPAPIHGKARRRTSHSAETAPGLAHFGVSAEAFFLRSELVASHAALEEGRDEANRLRAERSAAQTALATLAHEMRNPLASLELFTELLEADPSRAAEVLTQLRAGLRGLNATVSNVLRFYQGGSARLQPLTLGRVIAEAIEFARPLVDRAGLDLRLRGASLPAQAMADGEALQQLVLNLLGNAVRHTRAPGAVFVSLAKHGNRLRVTIRDTGEGIAPEHLPHIFRPGWSGAGSTGLGLAVAQRIAREHGSVLRVESKPGEGAAFTLDLPVLESPDPGASR